jgi:hypothetical protein
MRRNGFLPLQTPIDLRTLATLVGPQTDVTPWDKSGRYSFATGSPHAFSSKAGDWKVNLGRLDSKALDEVRNPS